MKRVFWIVFGVWASTVCGQEPSLRDAYVSDASYLIGTYEPSFDRHTPQDMARSAQAFLDALDEQQRQRVHHSLDSPERREWTNLPARPAAGGLRLGDCTETQIRAFCDLLASLWSRQGYQKLCHIMLADDQLLPGGQPRPGFGTETFGVVIFGEPSADGPWGFQLDGHHVGVNLAIEGVRLSMSPSFIGTQPQSFQIDSQSYRPLASEIDTAFRLANSLTREQRESAVRSPRRGQLRTGPGHDHDVPPSVGVSCATFDLGQRALLTTLIAQWVNNLPAKQAAQRLAQLRQEIDHMRFAWFGPTATGSDVSFAIQGPSLIIEYACQDLGGHPQNHLHTMYRDPTNEYGGQISAG